MNDKSITNKKKHTIQPFTQADKVKFLELFEESGNVTACASTIGFTRQTIWNHIDKDVAFRRLYFAIIDQISDEAESNLRRDIRENKKPAATIFWLKNRRKADWGDKVEMTHKHDKKALAHAY